MMESDKEEARRALDNAERKLSENDYNGAKEFASKAQKLYPKLDGLEQVLTITHVYICGSNGGDEESDWYGILGLDPLADEETVKRQYKTLALSLHPDKNRFHGAEGAFKLVSDAWRLLSDKAKRTAYDRKRTWKEIQQKKRIRPKNEPASSDSANQESQEELQQKKSQRPKIRRFSKTKKQKNEPASSDSANQEAQERLQQWLEKSREDVAAAVAAAKKNSQYYY